MLWDWFREVRSLQVFNCAAAEITVTHYQGAIFPISVPRVLKPGKQTTLDSAPVFVCPEPGCIKTFARFADFELHFEVGVHVVQNEPADLEHNMYDKLKRD